MSNTTTVTFPTSGTLATTTQIPSTPISLANGGTNAALTAANGGIFYSNASAGAILAATATAQQLLMSGASTSPIWSTTTYPTTNAINTLLYASSANVMAALSTANSGVLITSSGGVPSISSTLPSGMAATNLTLTTPTIGAATATSINFGGTTLSIYAEGTFTPTLLGASVAGVTGYTNQQGYYTRVGNMVFITVNISCSSATGTGNLTIGGLPFTVKNQTGNNCPGACFIAGGATLAWPAGCTSAAFTTTANTTTGTFYITGTAGANNLLQMVNTNIAIGFNTFYQI